MKRLLIFLLSITAIAGFSQSIPNVAFPTSEAVADTYTVNITNYGASYNDKVALINFRTANGGPATLNITPSGGSALGAKPLRKFNGTDWVPLASGDIRGDSSLYLVHYSSNCGCLRIVPQGSGSGGSQDFQSVMNLGSEATGLTTEVHISTDNDVVIEAVGTGNYASLENNDGGQIAVSNTVELTAGGLTYLWPTSAPASNGYVLRSNTDGSLAWVSQLATSDITGTQDLFISSAAMWPRTTGGCSSLTQTEIATSLFNVQSLDFDQSTDEFAQLQIVLPRKYNNGTVTIVVYWTAASGTGDVIWSINGGAYSEGDALSVALGTAQSVTDGLTTANDVHISSATSAITLAGTPTDADFLAIQISRDADNGSDTLNADAKLLGISVRITTDAAKDN